MRDGFLENSTGSDSHVVDPEPVAEPSVAKVIVNPEPDSHVGAAGVTGEGVLAADPRTGHRGDVEKKQAGRDRVAKLRGRARRE